MIEKDGGSVWDGGVYIDWVDQDEIIDLDFEDVVYFWDKAAPVLGNEYTLWESPSYRGRLPCSVPVLRFGLLTDEPFKFLCDIRKEKEIITLLVDIFRLDSDFRQLWNPRILEQARIDLAGYIFWPHNCFAKGWWLEYNGRRVPPVLWEKAVNIVLPAEDKEKPHWKQV